MNILIISEYFPDGEKGSVTGGVENRALNLARQLSKKHNVIVITSRQPGIKGGSFSDIKVMRYGPEYGYTSTGNLMKRALWTTNVMFNIPSIIKKHKIDVVDGQSFFCYPAALFSKFFTKSFMTYHETWLNSWIKNTSSVFGILGEIMERKVLFLSRLLKVRVISVSKATKKKLRKHKVDSVVAPNGISLDEFEKIKVKKTKQPSICFIGRLVEHKNVDDLIKAVGLLKKDFPGISYRIIGDGPEKRKLISLAKKLNLSRNILFLGYLDDRKDLIKMMKASWILCHPGSVEGFGIVLLEGMASGTPYVASDIDVFREVTENGDGGLLFSVKNHDDLADKLRTLINDKKLYRKKQQEAGKLVKKYEWENIAKDLEKIYRR